MNEPKAQQAGAVPFRRVAGRLELCLVTALRDGRWIFPKGMIDPGETARETALKEAWEEAGVRGRLVGPPLGTTAVVRWGRTLQVVWFAMEVRDAAATWDESDRRQRVWVDADEARRRLGTADLVPLVDAVAAL